METGFGDTLRRAREAADLTLEQAEEATKIRKFYLNALEEQNFAVLPARAYATGFVRRYSEYLGLDADEMARWFKSISSGMSEEDDMHVAVTPREGGILARIPMRNIAAGIIFVLLALWAGNYVADYMSHRAAQQAETKRQEAVSENKGPEKQTTPAPKPPEVSHPAVSGLTVTMKASGDCWYLVTPDQSKSEEGIMKAGEEKTFTAQQSLRVRLGNAGGVLVSVNGKDYGQLGGVGEVVTRVFTVEEPNPQS